MTKQDLINTLSIHPAIQTKTLANEILGLILDTITNEVAAGNDIYLGQNFGGFTQVTKAAKSGKALGVEYSVPARKAIKFKPSKALRAVIAGN